jgi:DNA-binding NarL/FixJ family response regulator
MTPVADRGALTAREREIARLVAQGFHNAEIARRLSISDVTVKTHINNIFRKLDVRDRVGLTLHALQTGLVGMPGQPPPDRSSC